MILDTEFIINLMNRESGSVNLLESLHDKGVSLAITTITLFELYSGVARSSKPDHEKQKIMQVLRNLIVYQLDDESAIRAGEIDGKLFAAGMPLDPLDLLIAAIALCHGDSIITRNSKHFSRIPGLQIVEY